MPDELISVEAAVALLDGLPVEPRIERVRLDDAAGLQLAEDVVTDRDFPAFDKSLMDGFAARIGEQHELQIVGESVAGRAFEKELSPGEAIRIMTGAKLPPGAVGVVPVEKANVQGDRVSFEAPSEADRYIARRGSDRPDGHVVATHGEIVTPAHIAALASVGADRVSVVGRPRCLVMTTGDEIVDAGEVPAEHQLRDANGPSIAGLLRGLGCEAINLPVCEDDLDTTRRRLAEALSMGADAVFVSGGMSMGERDYVPRVLEELGCRFHLRKLAIKPGKPFVVATHPQRSDFVVGHGGAARHNRETFVFGLPGNPVSAFVCTLILARRVLHRLAGRDLESLAYERLPLREALPANGDRTFYLPAKVKNIAVTPLRWKGSADVFTLAQANALIECPTNAPEQQPGEVVTIVPIPLGR